MKGVSIGRKPKYGESMIRSMIFLRREQIKWLDGQTLRNGKNRGETIRDLIDNAIADDDKLIKDKKR